VEVEQEYATKHEKYIQMCNRMIAAERNNAASSTIEALQVTYLKELQKTQNYKDLRNYLIQTNRIGTFNILCNYV